MNMAHTGPSFDLLFARLEAEHGIRRLAIDEVEPFAQVPGDTVLLLTEEPQRCPEAWDVAVVLPELLQPFAGRLRAGVLDPTASRVLATRFGVSRFPALLFQRGGEYVGTLEGMLDWESFVPAVAARLAAPVGRRPGIGVPLRAEGPSSCH